jgi:hypothetical protein
VVDWIGFSMYQNYGGSIPAVAMSTSCSGTARPSWGGGDHEAAVLLRAGDVGGFTAVRSGGFVRSTLQDLLGGRWPEIHGFSWWDETVASGDIIMAVPGEPILQQPFHDVLNGPLAPNLVDRPIFR